MAKLTLAIQYAVADKSACPTRTQFRTWIKAAVQRDVELTLRLVDEEESCALNRKYRGKNHATNVLTFTYADEAVDMPLLGDVVVCAPVVAKEAAEQGKPADAHWAHLTVHGVLHLQGFDHVRASDAKKMESLETGILAGLGYPDPYE